MKSRLVASSQDMITTNAVANSATTLLPSGAILIVTRSGILARTVPLARTTREVAINQDIKALLPGPKVTAEYLHYFLESEEAALLGHVSRGATVHRLETGVIRNLPISLPPLDEQRRIVVVLDAAFADLATATAGTVVTRQSLRKAFNGHLEQTFLKLQHMVPTASIANLCHTTSGGTPLRSQADYFANGKIPWLMSSEVGAREIHSSSKFITEAGLKASSAKLVPPDCVLVAMYGATAGEVGILRFASTTNQAVCAIHPTINLSPEYLYYSLLEQQSSLKQSATGNAQPNISQEKIRALLLPVPPSDQQTLIANSLWALEDEFQAIDDGLSERVSLLGELKQSLLHRAFTGQLT